VTRVDVRVMVRLSDQPTPPGILAVVRTPDLSATPSADGSFLVLDGVSDPGNVGTLIRTATALGVGVVSIGGADPFGPKAVRASAGTCYRARIQGERTLHDVAESIRGTGFVLVVGAEPDGIAAGARAALDGLVRIPMQGDVESLNVAAAGAIALHTLSGR
jgi:RNA methyltransferase, TrmH family